MTPNRSLSCLKEPHKWTLWIKNFLWQKKSYRGANPVWKKNYGSEVLIVHVVIRNKNISIFCRAWKVYKVTLKSGALVMNGMRLSTKFMNKRRNWRIWLLGLRLKIGKRKQLKLRKELMTKKPSLGRQVSLRLSKHCFWIEITFTLFSLQISCLNVYQDLFWLII